MPRKKGVPYERDALKQPRNFSLTLKAFQGLGRLTAFFRLKSTSALLEAIGRGELYVSEKPHTFEEAIAVWDLEDLAAEAMIPYERLIEIVEKKEKPTVDEISGLASSLKVETSELLNLIQNRKRNPRSQKFTTPP